MLQMMLHPYALRFTPNAMRDGQMRMRTAGINMRSTSFAALLCAAAVNVAVVQPAAAQQVRVDADDIGGAVTGAKGPEAGVSAVSENKGLPTKILKSVVNDKCRPQHP